MFKFTVEAKTAGSNTEAASKTKPPKNGKNPTNVAEKEKPGEKSAKNATKKNKNQDKKSPGLDKLIIFFSFLFLLLVDKPDTINEIPAKL